MRREHALFCCFYMYEQASASDTMLNPRVKIFL